MGVAVEVAVGVAVAVCVAVAVAVAVAVCVAVAVGEAVAVGVAVGPAGSCRNAASIWMRGRVTLPPGLRSVTSTPVLTRAARISLTEAFGERERNTAQAPATCGAAMEVPFQAS